MQVIRSILLILCLVSVTGVGVAADKAAYPSKSTATKNINAKPKVAAPININTADANKLTTLKGIGMKKAQAIVAYRKQNGDFKSIDELTKVKGMSQRIIKMNQGSMVLSDK